MKNPYDALHVIAGGSLSAKALVDLARRIVPQNCAFGVAIYVEDGPYWTSARDYRNRFCGVGDRQGGQRNGDANASHR